MKDPIQLPLFLEDQYESSRIETLKNSLADYGTFKDSMRAPIHSWFRYPAGYSYKLVDQIFLENELGPGSWVYDPFSGTGTTLVCAKSKGINGYGVEAHSFVHWVASVKLYWEFNYGNLWEQIENLSRDISSYVNKTLKTADTKDVFPELVYKCYHPQTLKELYLLREFINGAEFDDHLRQLMKLALTDTLRNAAAAGTGWPYIAPKKNTGDKPPKHALQIFLSTFKKMGQHLYSAGQDIPDCDIHNVLGDSRLKQNITDNQIDLALTSPPYLNNYDYADRTRLETYFWDIAQTWKDITTLYRDKLLVAATTQVVRRHHEVNEVLSTEIKDLDFETYNTIQSVIFQLAEKRLTKGGKKDYDLMVALYFNGILSIIQETFRILKPGAKFFLILGDSAPYGVHIPTEKVIGRLGKAVGFHESNYIEFRKRGGKWKENPQRHNVQLREGALILTK